MAGVTLTGLSKRFPDGTRAIDDVTLEVADGELLVCVGPSGSGKSTLLRLLAGLDEPSTGDIHIGERRVNDLPPQGRDVAMVFQNYALYPHMTVRDNLAFPLKMRGLPRTEIAQRVTRTARLLGLGALLERRPRQLSGGQRQRVAMGRALVRDPAVFLLDEPLSNLDAKLRVEIRAEIAALQRRLGTTTIYVTHDQVEAMTLGDRVAVFNGGRLLQAAPPRELYARPADLFVASFIGSPPMNLLRAELHRQGETTELRFAGTSVQAPAGLGAVPVGTPLVAGLRPEALHPVSDAGRHQLRGEITAVESLGHEIIVFFDSAGISGTEPIPGQESRHPSLAARLPANARVSSGDRLSLAFDPDALYVFTLAGQSLAWPTTDDDNTDDGNHPAD